MPKITMPVNTEPDLKVELRPQSLSFPLQAGPPLTVIKPHPMLVTLT